MEPTMPSANSTAMMSQYSRPARAAARNRAAGVPLVICATRAGMTPAAQMHTATTTAQCWGGSQRASMPSATMPPNSHTKPMMSSTNMMGAQTR